MTDKTYINSIGSKIRVRVDDPDSDEEQPDLSTATYMSILALKPSGEEVEWVGSQYIDPDDADAQKVEYTTLAGDLDEAGKWKFQAYVEWGSVTKLPGNTTALKVYDEWK